MTTSRGALDSWKLTQPQRSMLITQWDTERTSTDPKPATYLEQKFPGLMGPGRRDSVVTWIWEMPE